MTGGQELSHFLLLLLQRTTFVTLWSSFIPFKFTHIAQNEWKIPDLEGKEMTTIE